jgi:hypothetical protein
MVRIYYYRCAGMIIIKEACAWPETVQYRGRCYDRYIAIDLEMRAEDAHIETRLEKNCQSDENDESRLPTKEVVELVSVRKEKLAPGKWRQSHVLRAAAGRGEVPRRVFVAAT